MSKKILLDVLADSQSEDIDKQVSAIWEVINEKKYEEIPTIISLLIAQNDDIRYLAVEALSHLKDADPEGISSALMPMLNDSLDLIRADVIDVFADLAYAPALEPVLYALCLDSEWVVRATAAEAIPYLAETDDVIALEALESTLRSDSCRSVRSYAANSIGLLALPNSIWLEKLTHYYDLEESSAAKIEILGARYRLGDQEDLGSNLINFIEESVKEVDEQLFGVILTVLIDLLSDNEILENLIKDAYRIYEKIVGKESLFPCEINRIPETLKLLHKYKPIWDLE